MEEGLQLIANFKDWKAVKKIKITEKTPPFAILEFFASFIYSVNKKFEFYLGKMGDLSEIDSFLDNYSSLEEKIKAIKSRQMSKIFNSFVSKVPGLDKKQQKALKDFLFIYAIRRSLLLSDLKFSYSDVDLPSLQKLKKVKK